MRRSTPGESPAPRPRSLRRFLADQRGSTEAMEFVLVLPPYLTVVTVVIQAALLVVGSFVVQYAAYEAARSAIVQIPGDLDGEGRNVLGGEDSGKRETVREAAALACVPITPAIVLFGLSYGGAPANRVDFGRETLVFPRRQLAGWLTEVQLEAGSWGESEAVRVTVDHDMVLRVPIAAWLFGSLRFDVPGLPPVRVRHLSASATLLNQGRVRMPWD